MKNKYQFIFVALLCLLAQITIAADQNGSASVKLSLKPKECVVFKEGDKCYVDVTIRWVASKPNSFCLFRTTDNVQLRCWTNVSEGQFVENLVMEEPVGYHLAVTGSQEILASEMVSLSWVHKKSSRPVNSWRLF